RATLKMSMVMGISIWYCISPPSKQVLSAGTPPPRLQGEPSMARRSRELIQLRRLGANNPEPSQVFTRCIEPPMFCRTKLDIILHHPHFSNVANAVII